MLSRCVDKSIEIQIAHEIVKNLFKLLVPSTSTYGLFLFWLFIFLSTAVHLDSVMKSGFLPSLPAFLRLFFIGEPNYF